jgi:hypothetical protein
MICNLENINETIKKEGLNLLVVCYGGCVSNTLVRTLEKNNYDIMTATYRDILCHCPCYIDVNIPIIYLYDNPIKSFISMKKRGTGFWDVNQQKMSNNTEVDLSDENLIKLMINQFNSWTNIKRENVLIVKSCELFENSIVDKLEKFLKKKLYHFPILYETPKTNLKNINKHSEYSEYIKLFKKYKLELDKINNFINY